MYMKMIDLYFPDGTLGILGSFLYIFLGIPLPLQQSEETTIPTPQTGLLMLFRRWLYSAFRRSFVSTKYIGTASIFRVGNIEPPN
jgi:hypothetical protein